MTRTLDNTQVTKTRAIVNIASYYQKQENRHEAEGIRNQTYHFQVKLWIRHGSPCILSFTLGIAL